MNMETESKYFKIEYDPRVVISPEFRESWHLCGFKRTDKTRARINEIGWLEDERRVIAVQKGFDVDFDYLLALAQSWYGFIPNQNPEIVRRLLMGELFVRAGLTEGDIPADGEVFVVEFDDNGKTVTEWRPIILALVEDVTTPVLKTSHRSIAEVQDEAKAWMDSRPDTRSDYERGMDAITKSLYGFELRVKNPIEEMGYVKVASV